MNKEYKKEEIRKLFIKEGIKYQSFNNDFHWKIGHINFYPTTELWQSDNIGGDKGRGVDSLIRFLKYRTTIINHDILIQLSVEQMFSIAKKVKPLNLEKVCEAIHKAVYKGESNGT